MYRLNEGTFYKRYLILIVLQYKKLNYKKLNYKKLNCKELNRIPQIAWNVLYTIY